MIHRYWKFGICFIFTGLLSILSAYAAPLCCSHSSSCSSHSFPAIPHGAIVLKNLPAFNAIDSDGSIAVQIYGGADRQQVVLTDPRATRAEVIRGKLFLREGTRPLASGRLHVIVYMNCELNQLNLAHFTSIAGECIQSRCLTIFDESCGDLCLRGHIALNKLISTESGDIDIEWVDSDTIEIAADNTAHIHLGGRANRLYARLAGAATLDTQYLRVKSAWVKSDDASMAGVSSSESLNVFVNDIGNVRYFREPESAYINTQNSATAFWWD